jgi:hypothetical protein
MKFAEITGAALLKLAEADELPALHSAGVEDESKIRINEQGDIELWQRGHWSVIGGLLGDYKTRIKRMTGQDWT